MEKTKKKEVKVKFSHTFFGDRKRLTLDSFAIKDNADDEIDNF